MFKFLKSRLALFLGVAVFAGGVAIFSQSSHPSVADADGLCYFLARPSPAPFALATGDIVPGICDASLNLKTTGGGGGGNVTITGPLDGAGNVLVDVATAIPVNLSAGTTVGLNAGTQNIGNVNQTAGKAGYSYILDSAGTNVGGVNASHQLLTFSQIAGSNSSTVALTSDGSNILETHCVTVCPTPVPLATVSPNPYQAVGQTVTGQSGVYLAPIPDALPTYSATISTATTTLVYTCTNNCYLFWAAFESLGTNTANTVQLIEGGGATCGTSTVTLTQPSSAGAVAGEPQIFYGGSLISPGAAAAGIVPASYPLIFNANLCVVSAGTTTNGKAGILAISRNN